MRTGGQLIIDCLEAQGLERVFCVPGESYLAVLDALHDSAIQTIVTRHESGAAMMAEADGKLTGRPGVCMVTRGPGATNAAAGVHVARQDSTPMLLFIGQIGRHMKGREVFQEADYRQTFRDLAKWVEEIDQAARIPEIVSHAFHVAMSGRPGPVVLALPEDMLAEAADVAAGPRVEVAEPAPTARAVAEFGERLRAARNPLLILGGSRWDAAAVAEVHDFAGRWGLPAATSFRRQQLFDHLHPNFAGDIGLAINPVLRERVAASDLVILLGGRFSEKPSQNFSLFAIPKPRQPLIHIHPGAEELGRIYVPDLAINATPGAFLAAVRALEAPKPSPFTAAAGEAHAAYLDWSGTPPERPGREGTVSMGAVIRRLRELLPDDAVMTNGAGNNTLWLHRFWRHRRFATQLAPVSGSMGYGLPAAVAAKLRDPARDVICLAGDGCFQMTGQEFATAVQYGAAVIVLVADNGMHGTIRMHQERAFPGRVCGSTLVNPDFAVLARAYGGHGETVEHIDAFLPAFARAKASGKPAILHIRTDPEDISPSATLSGMRSAGR